MKNKDQIQPHYAEAFQCIGSNCSDTCCTGWQVSIDRQTYQKYQALPDLLPILDTKISRNPNPSDADFAYFNLVSARCPFLSEDRLCEIQKAHGAEYLPNTCAQFPRHVRADRDIAKKTLMMSCPEAARIVLLDPDLLPDEESGGTHARYKYFLLPPNASSRKTPSALDCLAHLQRFSITLLRDRRYPLWQRLFILGMFCGRLQDLAATLQPQELPPLLDNYAQLIVYKRLVTLMASIQSRPAFQLDVTLKFAERALQLNIGVSFRESLQDFRSAVPSTGDLHDEPTLAVYAAARDRYFAPLMQAHPYLLENYLVNYILQSGFLALNWNDRHTYDLPTEYAIMCTHYMVIRTMLIGISGHYREAFATQHVVKLVQGFSKAVEHSPQFMSEVAKFISDAGLKRPGQIATLLL